MLLFFHINLFILGLILGSFYNVVGLRIPKNESIIKPRSHCANCNRTLNALELIPVFSYVFLKGKCKGCKNRIAPFYPFVELVTGMLFAISPLLIGWNMELVVSLLLISLLIIIIVSDLHYQIIPDKVLLVFLPLLLIARVSLPIGEWWEPFVGGAFIFFLLWLVAATSRGGMGGGDIKLFGLLGIVLGWKLIILALFLSAFAGLVFGVIGLAIGKLKRKKPIPFGPAIAIGTLTVYFIGEEIIKWYSTFL